VLITPLVTAPYISRVLGAEGVGIYSYTSSLVTYFTLFAALGVVSYGKREIAQHRDDIKERSKIFWELELLIITTTAVVTCAWLIFSFLYKQYSIFLFLLTIQVIGVAFDISWFFTGLEEFSYIVIKNTICKIISIILLFVLVKDRDDVWIYLLILSGSLFAGNISTWTCLPKFLVKVDFKELNVWQHFSKTLMYFIPTIAISVYTVLDKTMIGLITGSNSVNGYYENATKIINMGKALTFASINSVLGSRTSYLFASNRIEEIKERIDFTLDYILFMGVAICFGIIGIAGKFVPWFFGRDFMDTVPMLIMLSPIIVIIGISNCAGSLYYTPSGRIKTSTKFLITGAVVNLILNSILIPLYSGYGAIIASLAAEFVITVLYVEFSDNFVSFKMVLAKIWKKIIAAGLMLLIVLYVGLTSSVSILNTMKQIVIGAIVYILLLLMMRDSFLVKCITYMKNKYRIA